ncbi:hypothetical protein JHK82_048369 [Glycine max]|nr:hypothetical protein JHK82_048369 [Glycine max]
MLGHIRSGTLDKVKEAFDKALKGGDGFSVVANNCIRFWFITMSAVQEVKLTLTELQNETDILSLQMLLLNKQTGIHLIREKLLRDIDGHVAIVRATKISELTSSYEVRLVFEKPDSCLPALL